MEKNNYVKVFASLGIYFGLIPQDMINVNSLKGSISNDASNNNSDRLYNQELEGVTVSSLYLMQHIDDGCIANCAFCIQARENPYNKKGSFLVDKAMVRVSTKTLKDFLKNNLKAKTEIKRICIQTIYNKKTVDNLFGLVEEIREVSDIPITACCIPISKESMIKLKNAGLNNITINYETATPELLAKIRGEERKGPYRWKKVTESLDTALEVYGEGNVGTHLQIGLGETQEEALNFIQDLNNKKIFVSLFAFTPVEHTAMENYTRVTHGYFHKIQLGSYIIKNNIMTVDKMDFDSDGMIIDYNISMNDLEKLIEMGTPFINSGCSGCNRIYYETNPGERLYSYPRDLFEEEVSLIKNEIKGECYANK